MSTVHIGVAPILLLLVAASAAAPAAAQWRIHDMERPRPPQVTPGADPGAPPSDAVVLIGGGDLSEWTGRDGGPAPWKAGDGWVEVVPRSGPIRTRRAFGDCQLHLEFATPPPEGEGQGRGNSGVFLMGIYEVQVLDSWENDTYPDGQAGAIYGQQPPLVNASRPPGAWQSYDIVFRRPRFSPEGKLLSPARFTIFHNGVLVQDGVEPTGPTEWQRRPPYAPHADALPLELQDHGNPLRFRNVWIRPLGDPPPQPAPVDPDAGAASDATADLSAYTGHYGSVTVELREGRLWLLLGEDRITALDPTGDHTFEGRSVDVTLDFGTDRDADGHPAVLDFTIGRDTRRLERQPR